MATRETQIKITTAALALFNAQGSASVSFDKIAFKAGISKGNLHYHFSSKEESVMVLWKQLETKHHRWEESISSTQLPELSTIMMHQFGVIWEYRFIYSELNFLLTKDPDLRYRFGKKRSERTEEVALFCNVMIQRGVLKASLSELEIRRLINSVWVISDYWLSYVFAGGREITPAVMTEGYELIAQLITPYIADLSSLGHIHTPSEIES